MADGEANELAKVLGQKICRKTGVPQLLISLNVDSHEVVKVKTDFKALTALEKQITDLLKSLL